MNDLVFQSGQTVLFIGDSITDCGRRQDQERQQDGLEGEPAVGLRQGAQGQGGREGGR